jgi:MoxR-like ATPase
MPPATHVLLKWNADREPQTIERHREIAERSGSVWWGRFAQPGAPGVSADRIAELRAQIKGGVPTFVFLYRRGDVWRSTLQQVTTDPNDVDRDQLPAYYTTRECNAFFRIGDFEHLEADWVTRNLRLANPSAGPLAGALGNQTTPLFVQVSEVSAPSAATPPLQPGNEMSGPTIWCVRAGQGLIALNRFVKDGLVALGWDEVGDPRRFGDDEELLRAAIARSYPGEDTGSAVGVFRRFLSEIRIGDLVITPGDNTIHFGRVAGEPEYAPDADLFRTYRTVEWTRVVARDELSVDAKNALSPQLTCFQVRGARAELLALAEDVVGAKEVDQREPRTWWVNQNRTYTQERAGNYVWAPKEGKGGRSSPIHWSVSSLRPGDRIFHYAGQSIRAVSTVMRSAVEAEMPPNYPGDTWERLGLRVGTEYRDLERAIRLQDIPEDWRIAEGQRAGSGEPAPFDRTGGVKQGYLWWLTSEFIEQLVARFPELGGGAVMVDEFDEQWRSLSDYLTTHPIWQTLAENVDVFDVEASNERINFRTNESKDVRTIYRGEFESHYRQLRRDGQLPRTWDTAKMACLALLPNVEYSLNPLTLYWVHPPSHEIGAPRQHTLVPVPAQPLSMAWLQEQTLWNKEELEELADAVRSRSFQVVLAGPPGTSKTWVARHLSRYLTQGHEQVFRTVQFHPSYSYEEFIEGLRPEADENGVIRFEAVPGVLLRMVRDVGSTPGPHILLIDEMNRANLPKVLGELMYLFEYRDEEIDLRYRTNFKLPSSLRFIGTMNTADRSIRSIDTALRRRFDVVECPPRRDILERYYKRPPHVNEVASLLDGFDRLNAELASKLDRHHTIGHTFFMTPRMTPLQLDRVWKHKIAPLIEEYFFDQPDIAAEFRREELWP